MISEQNSRMTLGWSCEQLAQASAVSVASIYLFERMGTAGAEDDARIVTALAQGKSRLVSRNVSPGQSQMGQPANQN